MPRKRYLPQMMVVAALACAAGTVASAQSAKPDDAPKAKPKSQTDTATKSAADQPIWDPLRSEKDIEVGQYYVKIGNLDAAMDRFNDAIIARPGYAIPFRYLGEAQEKKGMKREAIKSYTRYLDLYPHAEDRERIRKKIDRLWAEAGEKKKS